MALPGLLALLAIAAASGGAIKSGLKQKPKQASKPAEPTWKTMKRYDSPSSPVRPKPQAQAQVVPSVPQVPATPPQAGTDKYAPYASMRQFKNKSGQAVDSALLRTVIDIAERYQIDPKLAGAMAIQESNWNAKAIGGTRPPGYGLYQLTPEANPGRWDTARLTDPAYNAEEAFKMIRSGLDDGAKLGFAGDKLFRHALRRYNGGPQYWANVPGWGGRTRGENTRLYADAVMNWYRQ